jgi:subtilisin family serine protease
VDRNNTLYTYSNKGKNIDVVAPGVAVLSSVPGVQGWEASAEAGTARATGYPLEFAGSTSGVTGTLVNCGIGNLADFPTNSSGYIALIQRGTLSFAEKVTNAQTKGAAAVVIYNNVAGDFLGTLGSAGTWIPAISVPDSAGPALLGQLGQSCSVANGASSYDTWDGTSMATPHVSGTLALIWSANPALSYTTVESYLFTSCTDLGTAGYDTTFGRGLINASAAVAKAGK